MIPLGASSPVRAALSDMKTIICDLANQPTHMDEILQGNDAYVGFAMPVPPAQVESGSQGPSQLEKLVWRLRFQTTSSSKSSPTTTPRAH